MKRHCTKYEPLQGSLDAAAACTIQAHRQGDDYVNLQQLHLEIHAHHIAHNPKVRSEILIFKVFFLLNG